MNYVLIMSNDPILKKKNMDALVESGLRMLESSSALDGLLKLDKSNVDLIIIDEELSDTDGYSACKKVRQYSDTPIILLGVEAEENVWARIEELGFDLYLRKPLSPRELMARVKAVLRRAPDKPEDRGKAFVDSTPARVEKANYQEQIEALADMGVKICPACGVENLPSQKFCGNCAERLVTDVKHPPVAMPQEVTAIEEEKESDVPQQEACPNCGAQNQSGQNFCGKCAAKLSDKARATPITPLKETRLVKLDAEATDSEDLIPPVLEELPSLERTAVQVWQDYRIIKLLDAMASGKLAEIKPTIDPIVESSFSYPEVNRLLGTSGEEAREIIEQLENNDILVKKPYERFVVDRDGSFQLIPVEYCPQCDTGDLSKGRMIEHVTCGNISLDTDYRNGSKYICPKCKEELANLDTGCRYVRTQYRCHNNHTFSKPTIKLRNVKTGKISNLEELGETWIYSYSLRQDKTGWLEFLLKPKAQLVSFLQEQGYQVQELAKVQGKSGAIHTIDIVATRNDELANFRVGIGILTSSSSKVEISLDQLFRFDVIGYDTGIDYKIVIAIPKLSKEARRFADRQKIGVFEVEDPNELISFLDSQTNLSPSAIPEHDLKEGSTASGLKGKLEVMLRHHGYQVFENARVTGKSGAEHSFDIFAQRDDAIVRPTVAIAICHANGAQAVGIDRVSQFDAAAYDSGIQNKVLVGIPKVSIEGKQLAKQQRIKVIDAPS